MLTHRGPFIFFTILWLAAVVYLLLNRPRVVVLALLWIGLPLLMLTIVYILILQRSEIPPRYLIYLLPVTQFMAAQGIVVSVYGLQRLLSRQLAGAASSTGSLTPLLAMLLLAPLGIGRISAYYAQPQVNDFKSPCLFLTQVYTAGDVVLVEDRLNTQDGYRLYCRGLPPPTLFRSLTALQALLGEDTQGWAYVFTPSEQTLSWLDSNGFKVPFTRVTVYRLLDGGRNRVTSSEKLRLLEKAGEQAPTTRGVLLLLGRAYLQFGRYEDARQLFGRYVRLYPNDLEARIQLGAAYEGLNDLDQAEKLYQEAGRNNPAGILALASMWAKQGRVADAIALVQQILIEDNQLVAAYLTLAQLQQTQGDLVGAEDSLSRSTELEPENVQAWLNWAALALTQNDEARAETFLGRAIAVAPGQAAGYLQLANLYAGQDRQSEALALYDQAIALDPTNPNAYFQRGNLLNDTGNLEQALSDYQTALRQSDRQQLTEAATRRAANILVTQGQLEAALALIDEALKAIPESGDLYITQAEVFLAQVQSSVTASQQLLNSSAAERALNAARQRLPADDTRYAQTRAAWAALNGRPQEAIDWLQQAAEAQTTNVNLWRELASAQSSAKQYDAAQASLQQAITLAPEQAALHAQLAEVFTLQGNLSAAVSELESAVQLEPTNGSYQRALGDTYAATGNTTAALAAYLVALELQPNVVAIHRQLAALYWQSNDCAAAITHLEIAAGSEVASANDYLMLGDYYAGCAQASAAIKNYERAIETTPVRAHFKLGQLYASLGQNQAAAQEYAAVILAAPVSEFAQIARDWFVAQGLPPPVEATSTP